MSQGAEFYQLKAEINKLKDDNYQLTAHSNQLKDDINQLKSAYDEKCGEHEVDRQALKRAVLEGNTKEDNFAQQMDEAVGYIKKLEHAYQAQQQQIFSLNNQLDVTKESAQRTRSQLIAANTKADKAKEKLDKEKKKADKQAKEISKLNSKPVEAMKKPPQASSVSEKKGFPNSNIFLPDSIPGYSGFSRRFASFGAPSHAPMKTASKGSSHMSVGGYGNPLALDEDVMDEDDEEEIPLAQLKIKKEKMDRD